MYSGTSVSGRVGTACGFVYHVRASLQIRGWSRRALTCWLWYTAGGTRAADTGQGGAEAGPRARAGVAAGRGARACGPEQRRAWQQ